MQDIAEGMDMQEDPDMEAEGASAAANVATLPVAQVSIMLHAT